MNTKYKTITVSFFSYSEIKQLKKWFKETQLILEITYLVKLYYYRKRIKINLSIDPIVIYPLLF